MNIWFLKRNELPKSDLANELVGDDYGGIPASVIFVDVNPRFVSDWLEAA